MIIESTLIGLGGSSFEKLGHIHHTQESYNFCMQATRSPYGLARTGCRLLQGRAKSPGKNSGLNF